MLSLVLTASPPLALPGDTVADRVLGQLSFTNSRADFVDGGGLYMPESVALDRSVTPNRLYVADSQNNRVLGWADAATFADGAPANIVIGQPDFYSYAADNGGVSARSLYNPNGVADDSRGNLYVADTFNSRVLEYDSPFTDTTADRVFGQNGSFTGWACNLGVSSQPTANTLCGPTRVALDHAGRLYVADTSNNRVLEYSLPMMSTTANQVFGQNGSFVTSSGCNAPDTSGNTLCQPAGMAIDSGGRLYIADAFDNRVLRYDSPLTDFTADQVYGQWGSFSDTQCNYRRISANTLCSPADVASAPAGYLYVADQYNCRILEFNSPLTSTTANRVLGQSGNLTSGAMCSSYYHPPNAANLRLPSGLAVDDNGGLFIADSGFNRLLGYDQPLVYGAVANHVLGQPDFVKDRANRVDQIGLDQPQAVAIDSSVTPNRIYVADTLNSRVLGWNDAAGFKNGAPANLVIGQLDFNSYLCPAAGKLDGKGLCYPTGVAVDRTGNLYVADQLDNRVLEYNAPVSSGAAAHLVFGQGGNFTTSGCQPVSANSLCKPSAVAVDSAGNLYVADYGAQRVLKYNTPLTRGTTAAVVIGQPGFSASGCSGTGATTTCSPEAVAVDSKGNLYVADMTASRVLEFDAPLATGSAARRVFGQGGSLISAQCNLGGIGPGALCEPWGVGVDQLGNLYVADWANARVLEYNTPLTSGTIADHVFGQRGSFSSALCNNGGTNAASLCGPFAVAADLLGNVYIADGYNNRVLGLDQPLATPTPTATARPSATKAPTTTPTATASATPTSKATPTSTRTATSAPTPTASRTPTFSPTPFAKLTIAQAAHQRGSTIWLDGLARSGEAGAKRRVTVLSL